MIKICIVTVCLNALDDLKSTISSVRSQIYSNIHFIIIDGDSSDGTLSYLEKSDPLFVDWISEPDNGIYDAMNKGIDRCPSNSWVLFLNAGDQLANDNVLQALSNLLTPSVDFVFGDVTMQYSNYNHLYKAIPSEVVRMPSCHQGMLVRVELLKKLRFDVGYKVGADMDFYLRATKNRKYFIFYAGVISKIAPFGFSDKNETLLQKDYFNSIKINIGYFSALKWLINRKLSRYKILSLIYEKIKRN
jgi:glycosyltransferase involved in cell wall biosynthesis